MKPRAWLWILAPLLLSAGVLWLSAQEPKGTEGVNVSELAQKLQAKEKSLTDKERELAQLEQRLATLQGTLDKDRMDLQAREKTLQEAQAKFETERTRPTLDLQIVRTYESMEPSSGAKALKELAGMNQEVAVSLVATMQAKKAARIMDQLALVDAKLAGRLSERVGLTKAPTP